MVSIASPLWCRPSATMEIGPSMAPAPTAMQAGSPKRSAQAEVRVPAQAPQGRGLAAQLFGRGGQGGMQPRKELRVRQGIAVRTIILQPQAGPCCA